MVMAMTGSGFQAAPEMERLQRRISVDPWLEALNSHPGYLKLERQVGHETAIQVVELIETSGYPELVRAIIQVESGWRVSALSHRDARGLMQIRPIAAREVDPNLTPDDLYDPVVNVMTGIDIFENHMEYFLGFDDPEHWALTSYNRGRYGTFSLHLDPPCTRYSRKVLDLTDSM